nr:MAG TPA: hypothetical protein [Caudoviricetes sp.]
MISGVLFMACQTMSWMLSERAQKSSLPFARKLKATEILLQRAPLPPPHLRVPQQKVKQTLRPARTLRLDLKLLLHKANPMPRPAKTLPSRQRMLLRKAKRALKQARLLPQPVRMPLKSAKPMLPLQKELPQLRKAPPH